MITKINSRIQSLLDKLLSKLIYRKKSIRHNDISFDIHIPNKLNIYRVDTFSTKEPETLKWIEDYITDEDVLWDVGANIGLYSIYASKLSQCEIIAFEPSFFNLEFLSRNIFVNSLHNRIKIIPIALSNENGVNTFQLSSTTWGGALSTFGFGINQDGLKLDHNFEYNTAALTMDTLCKTLDLRSPTHIKIDVDGIEHYILQGGIETLKSVKTLLIEVNDDFIDQSSITHNVLTQNNFLLKEKHSLGYLNQRNQLWINSA